jgi:GNAT superfamily N-acetyltransferase
MKYTVPIAAELADELLPFWESIFGEGPADIGRAVFLGAEQDYSRSTLYLQREGADLAGTCFTMHSKSVPALAGFAEVATEPRFRGRGIASGLCGQAVEDFRAGGGEAFFLGTGNPLAARVYQRLGWRKLAGTNVMVNITAGDAPEAFLVDYFRRPGVVVVSPAAADVRVPMIPLIVTPHDTQVLDANVGLYSCRYQVQHSCMGLYPRYVRGLEDGGAFFAGRTEDGRVIGLASARLDGAGGCQVDGFVQHNFSTEWNGLVQAACAWGRERGAAKLQAVVAVEDEEKQALFEAVGFTLSGAGEDFDIEGRPVPSHRMEMHS